MNKEKLLKFKKDLKKSKIRGDNDLQMESLLKNNNDPIIDVNKKLTRDEKIQLVKTKIKAEEAENEDDD